MSVTGPELVGLAIFLIVFYAFVTAFALFGGPWVQRLKDKYHR